MAELGKPHAAERKYKTPLTSIQKMRLMRVLVATRYQILQAALEEAKLGIAHSAKGQEEFVSRHRRLQPELAGHFPWLDIRKDAYASDVIDKLGQEMVFYVLNGDTPG